MKLKLNPFYLIESGKLKIQTKQRGLIPFRLSEEWQAQLRLHKRIKEFWYSPMERLLIRILKARQEGISTFLEALGFSIGLAMDNNHGLLVANETDTVDYLFEMMKIFQAELLADGFPIPPLEYSNKKIIQWEGLRSSIRVNQGKNVKLGVGKAMHFVHLSEYALYPYPRKLMNWLMPSIPDTGKIIAVKETTSDGAGTAFHMEWLDGETAA